MKGSGIRKGTYFCRYVRISVLLVMFLTPGVLLAQITFERTYGGGQFDAGRSVQQTSDGGYIIAGQTESFGSGLVDVYLVKTDSLGSVLWDTTSGGSSHDWGFSVQQTLDDGYIVGGVTSSQGSGLFDVYLAKTDSSGNTEWDMTYGGAQDDWANCVQQTIDGGYVIAGQTGSFGSDLVDVYLIKADFSGNIEWDTTYGGNLYDGGWHVQQTTDGGYIIAGQTASFGVGGDDVYLIKTDSLGGVQWDTTYGGSLDDGGCCVRQTRDGGYIIAGHTSSFGVGGDDVYLIKIDSLGNIEWDTTCGGTSEDCGYSVQETFDGGYIVGGWTKSFGAGMYDVYLAKTDSVGNLLWDVTYGGSSDDWSNSVQQTSDSGFVVAGYTNSSGAGGGDVYLIKTDENGLTGIEETGTKSAVPHRSFQLFQNHPNPFHHSTVISYVLPQATEVTLEIYDITGRLVETLVNERHGPGIHQVRWDRKTNPSGVYFYRLKAGEFVETKKMVVVQ